MSNMSLSGTGMQKIQNLGSYALEAQGSRKHEGEWPNKPGIQRQAWHNNLTKTKLNSVALVRERTIPTERPPPVGEVSANFCG